MTWRESKIGEYFDVKHGYAFKGHFFGTEGEYIVVTPGNFHEVGGFRHRGNKEKYYTQTPPDEYVMTRGDLVIAMTEQGEGLLGSSALIPSDGTYLHNQRIGLVVDLDQAFLNRRFLYYLLNTRDVRMQIRATATGTKVKHTAPSRIKAVTAKLPPVDVQARIAEVLGAYDDLIENNNRRMALLEEALHLLYREWFVYLRFPGHERVKIVDGMPEGWERVTVGSLLAKIPRYNKVKKSDYVNKGLYPVVDQSTNFIGGFTNDEDAIQQSPLPVIVFGDHTRILKFVDFPFARGADGTQVLYPNRPDVSTCWLYCALSSIDLSSFGYARHFKYLKESKINIPSSFILLDFDALIEPMLKQIGHLRRHNERLREARDLMLPRLMNGSIPV